MAFYVDVRRPILADDSNAVRGGTLNTPMVMANASAIWPVRLRGRDVLRTPAGHRRGFGAA
jgi:hypothetical protein